MRPWPRSRRPMSRSPGPARIESGSLQPFITTWGILINCFKHWPKLLSRRGCCDGGGTRLSEKRRACVNNSFDSLHESASAFFINGEYNAACKAVSQALGMRPENCDALRLAAQIMAGLDDSQAAVDYIDRAILIKPDDADLHDAKAGILIMANSFADAEV